MNKNYNNIIKYSLSTKTNNNSNINNHNNVPSNSSINITVSADDETTNNWLAKHIIGRENVVGLDAEWSFTAQKQSRISLLQIATHDKVLIIRFTYKDKILPLNLIEMLKSSSIIKTGVEVKQDLMKIRDFYNTTIGNYCDTSKVYHAHYNLPNTNPLGLYNLANKLFNTQLVKNKSISKSNWDNTILKNSQLRYAALDAILSRRIYDELSYKLKAKMIIESAV